MQSKYFAVSGLALAVLGGALALFLSSCKEAETPAPPPRAAALVKLDLEARCTALREHIAGIDAQPWFAGTVVADALERVRAEIGERLASISPIRDADALEGAMLDRARAVLDANEGLIGALEARLENFDAALTADLATVRDAYTEFTAAAQALAILSGHGIPCPEEQSRLTEIARRHEEGRRMWLEDLRCRLAGVSFDDTIRQLGAGTIGKSKEEVAPLRGRLHEPRIEVLRFDNHLGGIARTLRWAAATLEKIPEVDDFRRAPASDLAKWQERFTALEKRVVEARLAILDRSRERQQATVALCDELGAFLRELNGAFLPKAREHGLPLPEES